MVNKNLHEIKQDVLRDYAGEFEMVGNLKIVDQICQTHSRFRNIADFEAFINAIDQDYESEGSIFNGYIYKTDTTQFNLVNRSQYGNGCDFKHEIVEYPGKNCFITTKGYCFVKGNNFLTGGDYKEQDLNFIRKEKRRSNVMTKARIQSFCRANNYNLGFYVGKRVFPRKVTDRNNALFLYNIHLCLLWRTLAVGFNRAIIELKGNFKIVDNFITEEKINSHFNYEYIPKKVSSQLTNFIVYDLATHNIDTARPYCISFCRLSKFLGRHNRDIKSYEVDECKKDTIVFDGDNCVTHALHFCLKLKGEERRTSLNTKFVDYNLQLHAHNGSGFDTWIILKNLPCDKHNVDIIKNGRAIISMKFFNGYIYNGKK